MWFVRVSRIKVKIRGLNRSPASISWHMSLFILNVGVDLMKRQPGYFTLLFFYNLSWYVVCKLLTFIRKLPAKHPPLLPCFSCICLTMSFTDSRNDQPSNFDLIALSTWFQVSSHPLGFPGGSDRKESACIIPVFLPGKSHGQKSLVG